MPDFHAIYDSHATAVRRFALFLCGDPTLADDLTSEAFVRAWTASGEIREPTVRAYLLAIVRNLYRDLLRRQARHTELSEALPDRRLGADKQAEQNSELQFVLDAMQALPEVDRAALLMLAQEEMSYQDIADLLGLPLATVKTKIHRARLKLIQARMRKSVAEGAKS